MFALSIMEAERESRGFEVGENNGETQQRGEQLGGLCLSKQVAALRLMRVPGW